jgi:hypothetical protein
VTKKLSVSLCVFDRFPSNTDLIPESALIRRAAAEDIHHREWKCSHPEMAAYRENF